MCRRVTLYAWATCRSLVLRAKGTASGVLRVVPPLFTSKMLLFPGTWFTNSLCFLRALTELSPTFQSFAEKEERRAICILAMQHAAPFSLRYTYLFSRRGCVQKQNCIDLLASGLRIQHCSNKGLRLCGSRKLRGVRSIVSFFFSPEFDYISYILERVNEMGKINISTLGFMMARMCSAMYF